MLHCEAYQTVHFLTELRRMTGDAVIAERASIRGGIKWAHIEALLDGKLTVDQVVEQEHEEDDVLDLDGIHRGILESALEKFKEGIDRNEIIEDAVESLEMI